MQEPYTIAYWGILIIIATVIIQGCIAAASKASKEGAIPGKIDESLSHSSFVFRSNRTFMNSLENFPAIIGTSILAIFVGANVFWTGVLILVFALSRIIHMILYYLIATEKNPSPRSYFFIIGLASNIALLVLCGAALV
ncbi:MAG: MAPEG family protein [Spongiibacteraceae bacterium]